MKHLYYRGNLEGKLLFQQNDGDMAVVRLEQDQLVFIPVGGPSVRFILIHATVTTEDSSTTTSIYIYILASIKTSKKYGNGMCHNWPYADILIP